MQGKVVVVTGAFGVLGVAVTERARAMGARTALIDYASAPANLRTDPLVIGGVDLTKMEDATAAMARVRENAGRIDALLNIAGGFVWSTLEDSDDATWERMHSINLKTAVNASHAALPHLIEIRRRDRECRRGWRVEGRRWVWRLRGVEGGRAQAHRKSGRRAEGQGARQRGAAVDPRHRAEPP